MFGHRPRTQRSQGAYDRLNQIADNYERNNADAPTANPRTSLASSKYNPEFDAQFNIEFQLKYFTVAGGVYTEKTAAQLLAAGVGLATKLPVFLFGQADFQSGYVKAQSQFPLAIWQYEAPFVYGTGGYAGASTSAGTLDAIARALLSYGDLVQPFSATVAGPVTWVAFSVVKCSDVGYGTLLASSNSDRFLINLIRLVQNDTSVAGLNQFNQKLQWFKQSLFGQFNSDSGGPNAFKMPENLQSGIIDVPIIKPITKEAMLATYLLYTTVTFQFSIFVLDIKKAGNPGSV